MKYILWFISLIVILQAVFVIIGYSGLTGMFPEGKRWWHLPLQYAILALYAVIILNHPF